MINQIIISEGPKIGDGMLFISIDLVAFLVVLMFILRIGTGKLAIPMFFISLSFLLSALVPLLFGLEELWVVPVLQSLFTLIGVFILMKILGVFDLMSKK